MTDQTICDNCRMIITGRKYSLTVWDDTDQETIQDMDLCHACQKKLKLVFK